jgi:hypothetical protein
MYRFDELGRRSEPEVVELSVLLPSWQAEALEEAARDHGLTTGQMLRRLIGDLVAPGVGMRVTGTHAPLARQ